MARSVSATEVVNHLGAWTDDQWFATLRLSSPTQGTSTAELLFFPRSGPAGAILGTPQTVTAPAGTSLSGPMGEHVVAAPTATGATFFRPTGGVWVTAGSVTLPDGYQLSAMTDRWLAARRIPGAPGTSGDGEVQIYSVDSTGPTVTATLVTVLGPDPAWPTALREGFGQAVSLDDDLLAVSATGFNAPTPGGVRVFRATAGTWSPVQSLGAGSAPARFGNALAVDDGAVVDRVIVATQFDALQLIGVESYADVGTGFAVEQALTPDPALPDASNGLLFGSSMAIDDDLLTLTARSTTVTSSEVGHAPVTVGHVQLFRRGPGGWTREAEVGTFTDPYDPDVASAFPLRLQAAGNHVAAALIVNPDPPVGCQFPCFNLGLEAWSLDRS